MRSNGVASPWQSPLRLQHSLLLTQVQSNVSTGQAVAVELVLTLQLVLCVFASTNNRQASGSPAIVIGISVALGHLIGVRGKEGTVCMHTLIPPWGDCRGPEGQEVSLPEPLMRWAEAVFPQSGPRIRQCPRRVPGL